MMKQNAERVFEPQVFGLPQCEFDVEKAWDLVRGRPPNRRVNVAHYFRCILEGEVEAKLPHALSSANLSDPLIVVPYLAGELVIDGWHRILLAYHAGRLFLPAHALTYEEARRIYRTK